MVTQFPVSSVIPHQSGQLEEPGFRNGGVLRISDDELQITTTWWNWRRHVAMPLGLLTCDLSAVFAGPQRSIEVTLTMRCDKLESVRIRPDAEPSPSIQFAGIREEDGESWLCDFKYRASDTPLVERLKSCVRPERLTRESGNPVAR